LGGAFAEIWPKDAEDFSTLSKQGNDTCHAFEA